MQMKKDKIKSEDERAVAIYNRKLKLLGPEKMAQLIKSVENRIQDHLLQDLTEAIISKDILGGEQFFGVRMAPRLPTEPFSMEAKYVVDEIVTADGKAKCRYVTLRCWDDWDCKSAIELNKAMVARICFEEHQKNFSTRMQTDVQTRTVIMWMRLRGKFFWNKNSKVNNSNLYFDDSAKILRVIHSDDFKGWLHAHTQINPSKADFDFLMNQIDAAAMNSEIAHECVPGALFDRRGDVVYVSCGDSKMMKVSPAEDGFPVVDEVPNGTDNVVFTQGMTLEPWEIVDGEGEDPFDTCPPFSSANYESEHGRMIARLWFLGLASCLRSYPAIVFTGKMRSGKSRTAKGLFELLGAPNRLSAIRANGENDFWTVVNKGGVVCFDNVDTKNVWFGDAMQLACTDGSTESRTLFTNDQTTTLRANAKIVMTSNNPMFASESGLADRLQIVRLGQFDGKNGKESGDSAISEAISEKRNAALTWFVRTVSRALSDTESVEANVNMRHPDFAAFAMRCARSISKEAYQKAILALKSAEFDKSYLTLTSQPTSVIYYIYEAFLGWFTDPTTKTQIFDGSSAEIMDLIVKSHPDLEHSKYISAVKVGTVLGRYYECYEQIFVIKARTERGHKRVYTVSGFTDNFAKNHAEVVNTQDNEENSEIDDMF